MYIHTCVGTVGVPNTCIQVHTVLHCVYICILCVVCRRRKPDVKTITWEEDEDSSTTCTSAPHIHIHTHTVYMYLPSTHCSQLDYTCIHCVHAHYMVYSMHTGIHNTGLAIKLSLYLLLS